MPRTGRPSKMNRCSSLTRTRSSAAIIEGGRVAARRRADIAAQATMRRWTRPTFDAARRALATARVATRARSPRGPPAQCPAISPRPIGCRPRWRASSARSAAGRSAAVTPAQRESLGVDRADRARRCCALDARLRRSAAPALRAADFIAPKLECEFAFELARDLPPRPERAYSRDEVRAAIGALRIAVEIVDSRLPRGLGALAELERRVQQRRLRRRAADRRLARARPRRRSRSC